MVLRGKALWTRLAHELCVVVTTGTHLGGSFWGRCGDNWLILEELWPAANGATDRASTEIQALSQQLLFLFHFSWSLHHPEQ